MLSVPQKLILRLSIGVLFVIAGLFLCRLLTTAKISINSGSGVEIYVKQGDQGFEKIGMDRVIFKTRSEETVFVEARSGNQATQKAIEPQRRKTIAINVRLKPLSSLETVADGPIIHPHIENGFIYGINPHNNSLVARPLRGVTATAPRQPLLPFLKTVVWVNSRNFLYITLGRGSGLIHDGHEAATPRPFAGTAVSGSKIALLGSNGLYFYKTFQLNSGAKIADIPPASSPQIFSDDRGFYFTALFYQSAESEDVEPQGKATSLTIFGPDGSKRFGLTLPITQKVYKVTGLSSDSIAILSDAGIMIVTDQNGSNYQEKFSFGRVRDMVVYHDRLLLLSDAGLWEYDPKAREYNKIASYPERQAYVPDSLIILDKYLYLSTSATDEALIDISSPSSSNVFRVLIK